MWTSKSDHHRWQPIGLSVCVLTILLGGTFETAAGSEQNAHSAGKSKHQPHCGRNCMIC